MGRTIYREYNPALDMSLELEYTPNAWTSYHLTMDGVRLMSYDSLIDAAAGVVQTVAALGGDPQEALDSIIEHFNDDKIYAGEIDGDELPWLVNEYEWDINEYEWDED